MLTPIPVTSVSHQVAHSGTEEEIVRHVQFTHGAQRLHRFLCDVYELDLGLGQAAADAPLDEAELGAADGEASCGDGTRGGPPPAKENANENEMGGEDGEKTGFTCAV